MGLSPAIVSTLANSSGAAGDLLTAPAIPAASSMPSIDTVIQGLLQPGATAGGKLAPKLGLSEGTGKALGQAAEGLVKQAMPKPSPPQPPARTSPMTGLAPQFGPPPGPSGRFEVGPDGILRYRF